MNTFVQVNRVSRSNANGRSKTYARIVPKRSASAREELRNISRARFPKCARCASEIRPCGCPKPHTMQEPPVVHREMSLLHRYLGIVTVGLAVETPVPVAAPVVAKEERRPDTVPPGWGLKKDHLSTFVHVSGVSVSMIIGGVRWWSYDYKGSSISTWPTMHTAMKSALGGCSNDQLWSTDERLPPGWIALSANGGPSYKHSSGVHVWHMFREKWKWRYEADLSYRDFENYSVTNMYSAMAVVLGLTTKELWVQRDPNELPPGWVKSPFVSGRDKYTHSSDAVVYSSAHFGFDAYRDQGNVSKGNRVTPTLHAAMAFAIDCTEDELWNQPSSVRDPSEMPPGWALTEGDPKQKGYCRYEHVSTAGLDRPHRAALQTSDHKEWFWFNRGQQERCYDHTTLHNAARLALGLGSEAELWK